MVYTTIAKGTSYVLKLKQLSSILFSISISLMKCLYLCFHPQTAICSRHLDFPYLCIRIAMLSITGAMCTSPTDMLEILSNTWPLMHHIQNLCYQAALWLAAVPNTHLLCLFVNWAAKKICQETLVISSLPHLCVCNRS